MNRYIEKFVNYLDVERNYSRHTILNYSLDLEDFFKFLDKVALEKCDYLFLRKYLAYLREKQHRPRSLARKLSSLRSFFRFLLREGLLKNNPALLMMSPKLDKTLPKFLTEEEMARFIESASDGKPLSRRDRAMMETLYSTGIRVSELVGMNVHDVDFIGNTVKVFGKGKKERIVPIGDKALGAMRDYLQDRLHQPGA